MNQMQTGVLAELMSMTADVHDSRLETRTKEKKKKSINDKLKVHENETKAKLNILVICPDMI